jgi:hypothetical protein
MPGSHPGEGRTISNEKLVSPAETRTRRDWFPRTPRLERAQRAGGGKIEIHRNTREPPRGIIELHVSPPDGFATELAAFSMPSPQVQLNDLPPPTLPAA